MLRLKYFIPLALFISLCVYLPGLAKADEQKTWINSDPAISIGQNSSDSYYHPNNTDCISRVFPSLIFKTTGDTAPTETSNSACMANNPLGSFGGGYLIPGGAGYGYKTLQNSSRFKDLIAVPNQPMFLATNSSGAFYPGSFFFLNKSVRSTGTFKAVKNNYYKGYVFDMPSLGQQIKDPAGNGLSIKHYAFSKNGEWMLMEVLGVGFARMNLNTGEMKLFSNQYFSYGNGFTITFNFAISNDGKYIAISNRNYGTVTIYDSENCQSAISNWSIYNHPDPKCQKREIGPYIKSKAPDYYWLSSLRFGGNDRNMQAVLTQKPGGIAEHSRVELYLDEQPSRTSYIAMGDSFASGEGDMDDAYYEDGTNDGGTNLCHLSKRSYPYLLNNLLGHDEFHSVACSGARIPHILNTVQYDKSSLNTQLGQWMPGRTWQSAFFDYKPSYITLSIGGNDLGFGDILGACVISDKGDPCRYASDPQARADTAKRIAGLHKELVNTYDQIIDTTDKKTKLYVMGYPQFINPNGETCGKNVQLDETERRYITKSVNYANQVIKSAAIKAGAYYLDVENALNGRNLCSFAPDSQMAVNGLTKGDDKPGISKSISLLGWQSQVSFGILGNESFHPNQNGHEILKNKILELTGGNPADFETCNIPGENICKDETQKIPLPDRNYFGEGAYNFAQKLNDPGNLSLPSSEKPSEVSKAVMVEGIANRVVDLGINAFELATGTFRIVLHSEPVELGAFTANGESNLKISVEIPEDTESGLHELHLIGNNIAGEPVDYFVPIYISGQEPESSCGLLPESGVDVDQDGIDDACDGYVGQAPIPEEPPREDPEIPGGEETPTDPDQNQPPDEDPKKPLEESVAGLEDFTDDLNSSSPQDSTRTSSNNLAYIQPADSSYPEPNTARSLGENAAIASSTDSETYAAEVASNSQSKSYLWLVLSGLFLFIAFLTFLVKNRSNKKG